MGTDVGRSDSLFPSMAVEQCELGKEPRGGWPGSPSLELTSTENLRACPYLEAGLCS